MRNITLLTLAPFAFASQAAQVLDYSETDISSALNIPHSAVHSVANRKLSYQDLNRVEIGKQVFVRKQQLHYGIPVYGHSIVADLSTQGFVQPIAGHVVTGIEEDIDSTLPMISAKQAIEIATGASQGYTVSTSQSNDAQADLLIWLDEQKNARLIYKVDALQIENHHPSRPITFVDAKSGKLSINGKALLFIKLKGQAEIKKAVVTTLVPTQNLVDSK